MKTNLRNTIVVNLLLLAGDLLVVVLAFYASALIRAWIIPYVGGVVYWPVYQPVIKLAVVLLMIIFYFNDLYPGYGKTAVREIRILVRLLTVTFLVLGGTIFYLNAYEDFPRSILILAWLLAVVFVPLMRVFIRHYICDYKWYGVPVIYISDQCISNPALNSIQKCRRMGWNPVAIYALMNTDCDGSEFGQPLLKSWAEVLRIKEKLGVNIAVFSSSKRDSYSQEVRRLSNVFNRVTLVFPYDNIGSLWINPRDLEGILGLEISYHLLNPVICIIKRLIDILGSLFLLILLSPVFIFLSIWICLESPGPIFFRQDRLWRNDQTFEAIKFRSMVKDAEEKLQQLLETDPRARQEYSLYHKLENDPRITRVGKYLRKFSLDELPQLWNVLRGEMSLIGPRAYMPAELDDIGDYLDVILKVRPGMTGWWQVMGRHNTTFENRLRMDEYYISNWSLWMDLYIFYKTFWVVIQGTGT